MTDRDALLAGIVADPADDLPRLVFADYLDDHGDADRAEFIRVQCEMAAGPAADRRGLLTARERELRDRHRKLWRVPGLAGSQRFVRGFVESVETTADSLIAAGPDAFRGVPVRTVRLVNADRRVDEAGKLPVWRTVESLVLNNNTFGSGDRLRRFFAPGHFPRLTSLHLRHNLLWPDGVQALAALDVTPRLTVLDVSANPVTDDGAACLATHPGFRNLRELSVRSDELHFADCVHAVGAAAVAGSRTLTRLTALNFAGQYLGDAGLISLAASPNSASLADLNLSYNDIGALGAGSVEELVNSRHFPRLERLNLAGNRFAAPAVAALLRWPRLATLARLDLRDCGIGDAGRDLVRASPFAGKILADD